MDYDYEYDDEPLEERPLKEWSKKQLRKEVRSLRQELDEEMDELRKARAERGDLSAYIDAHQRHGKVVAKLADEVFDRWLAVDMRVTVEQPPPVDASSMNSIYTAHIGTSPRATVSIEMQPKPPLPKDCAR